MTLWTLACQAPLSMGFFRQEYWSGFPFPPPEDLPHSGIELMFPSLQTDSLPPSHWWGSVVVLKAGPQTISITRNYSGMQPQVLFQTSSETLRVGTAICFYKVSIIKCVSLGIKRSCEDRKTSPWDSNTHIFVLTFPKRLRTTAEMKTTFN